MAMKQFSKMGKRAGREKFKRFNDIEDHVPFIDIYGNLLLDIYACSHAFYEVDAPAADVASTDRLAAVQEQLANMVDHFPEKICQIQFNYATSGDYRKEITAHAQYGGNWPVANRLRETRATRLLEETKARSLIKTKTVMILSVLPKNGGALHPNKLSLAGGGDIWMAKRIPDLLDIQEAEASLKIAESVVDDCLQKVGIRARRMSSSEIASFYYELFNQDLSGDWGIPINYNYDETPFNDAWLCNSWEWDGSCFKIGEYWHSWISMNAKPQESTPRLIERITTGLPMPGLRVCLSIRRLDKSQEADRLRTRRNLTMQRMKEPLSWIDKVISPSKKEDIRTAEYNIEAKDEIDEANILLSELRSGKEFLAMCQLVVHTWSRSREEIMERREIITSRIADMNKARGLPEYHSAYEVMRSSLPGSVEPLYRWVKVKGKMAADLVPLDKGFEGGQEDPVCLFRNRSGGLVKLNLFQKGVANAPLAFVSGASGSGKSFLVNQIIMQHLIGDSIGVIMDVGGSYAPLIEIMGGQMIKFDTEKPLCINPLQVYGSPKGTEPSASDRARICRAIEPMLIQPDDPQGVLPPHVIAILDRAVEAAFAESAVHFTPFVTLSDLHRIINAYPDGGNLVAARLKPFTRGQLYGQWFDGPTTIDLRSRMVCFDMKGIAREARLMKALAPMVVNYVYDIIMANRSRPKMLIMDEMWSFLAQERIMNFVVEAWKTFRKENTLVVGISQSLAGDVASNKYVAAAVVQNTETWFMLSQGKEVDTKAAVDLLGLTEGQSDLLLNLKQYRGIAKNGRAESWRECLLIRASHNLAENSGVIRIQSTPEEYWLATTEPAEAAMLREVATRMKGDFFAAAQYLAEKHPAGLAPTALNSHHA
jgi:hypothetical protein